MLQQLKPEINFCNCGCEARLVKQVPSGGHKGKMHYQVQCLDEGCSATGTESPYPWQAILEWNAGDVSEFPEDFPVPFLNASGLSVAELLNLITRKRNDFQEQVQKLKSGNSGASGQEKIKTLSLQLDWLNYGERWMEKRYADKLHALR